MTEYIFEADFDGTLRLRVGDTLEIKIVGAVEGICNLYDVAIIRQTSAQREPPALGVSVSDNLDLSDRLG